MTDTAPRLTRLCDVCGQLDDDPRHVQGVQAGFAGAVPTDEFIDSLPDSTPPRAVAELMDPGTVIRHQDCCAAQGCAICQATEQAHGGKRGDALLKSIHAGHANALSGSKPEEG